MHAMTRPAMSVSEPTLYVAFELGKKDWKLAMTAGFGLQPWLRTVASKDWPAVERAIAQGRARFGLSRTARVVSCYEAGRDGFWIHRALEAKGVANRVVDSASIEVSRRARRGEDGSPRCAQAGDDVGAGVWWRAAGVERGPRADGG